VDKQLRQEAVLLRAIEGTLPEKVTTQAVAPTPAPANDFAAQFDVYANTKVTVKEPTQGQMPLTVEDMLEQLRANGSTTIPTEPTPTPATLTVESTKAELAAVVSKNLGIDVKQAMLMNKETLVSLL
jgi:hypothetical protein